MKIMLLNKNNEDHTKLYIYIFTFIIIVLFFAFLIGLFQNPNGTQRNIFFIGMNDFFADFFNVLRYISERDPYFNEINGLGEKGYAPFSYLILYPFSQLDNFNTMSLPETWNSKIGLMSVFIFTSFSLFLLFLSLNCIGKKFKLSPIIFIGLILSYIMVFSIERGNTIILCVSFVNLFICYYDSENKKEKIIAIISLAIAVTLKFYPVILGFLYFEKKQYREIFISAALTIFLIFIPFLFFKRGFGNIPQWINNIRLNSNSYSFTRVYPRISLPHITFHLCSLLNVSDANINLFSKIAKNLTIIFSVFSIFYSIIIKNNYIKISLLILTILFLPENSALYCCLYLFPLIVLYFGTLKERKIKFNIFILTIFIIILNPYQIKFISPFNTINYLLINIALFLYWVSLLFLSSKRILLKYIKGKI